MKTQQAMTIEPDTIVRVCEGFNVTTYGKQIPGCTQCGHLSCVCDVLDSHAQDCPYRRAVTCAVAIECEHGYDVCPKCDPCTCNPGAES